MLGLGLTEYVPIIIYIGAFIIFFLAIFYRLELGLFFLIPLIPWQSIWIKIYKYPLGKDIIDILTIALLITWFLTKNKYSEKIPHSFPLILLIIISFLSLFIGTDGFPISSDNRYFIMWKNFIFMPILYIVTFNIIREERQIKILIFLMALSMLANDFYFRSTFEYFKSEHFSHRGRISTFEDLGPNEMASFVSQGTMMLLGIWLMYKHRWRQYIIGFIILFNFYAILYSYSRGSYLAVLAASFFLGLIKEKRILVVLVLLGILWTSVLPNAVIERIEMTTSEEGAFDSSSSTRLDVWKNGLSTFAHNPLGVGFGKFQLLGLGENKRTDAHNMPLKMLVELGIPGLSIYLFLYIIGFKSGWNLYKAADSKFLSGLGLGFMACIIANATCNFFGQDWAFYNVTSYYWTFWAVVMRASVIIKARTESVLVKQVLA